MAREAYEDRFYIFEAENYCFSLKARKLNLKNR